MCPVAFDVIGQITFSRTLGFLEQGRDVDGILQEIDAEFNYRSIVCNYLVHLSEFRD